VSSTAQAHSLPDKLVILAVSSASTPSYASPPAGTGSTLASALSPLERSKAEVQKMRCKCTKSQRLCGSLNNAKK